MSAKQKYRDGDSCFVETFHGASHQGQRYVNGQSSYTTTKIVKHFNRKEVEIDIYVNLEDPERGILRLCVVGMMHKKYETEISGLNVCGNDKGWIPHLVFGSKTNIKFRAAKISARLYGRRIKIEWE